MVNRSWSLFFLLIANIILLGHAVIPHHHSDNLPVLVSFHNDHTDECKPISAEHHCDHHSPKNGNELFPCTLNQLFVDRSNSNLIASIFLDNNTIYTYLYITPKGHYRAEQLFASLLPSIPEVQPRTHYSAYLNHCLGLRAPPLA